MIMEFNGLDEEEKLVPTAEKDTELPARPKKAPFAYWEVGGRSYKLKLTTSVICQLENKYRRNLLDLLFTDGSTVPPLALMLTIVHGAMKTWEHGIKYESVQNLFDKYLEEGGTQMTFMTDVLIPVYGVSGFFTEDQQEGMARKVEEAKEMM